MAKCSKAIWAALAGLILAGCADGRVANTPTSVPTSELTVEFFWGTSEKKTIVSSEVEVLWFSRQATLKMYGREVVPKDDSKEVLAVGLLLPPGTTREAIYLSWLEDGGTHGPRVLDQGGQRIDWQLAYPGVATEEGVGYVLVFLVGKAMEGLTLVFPDGLAVDLATVPDLTPDLKPSRPEPGLKRI